MTLRVALVVDGNSSGAQKAVEGAASSVHKLATTTHEAATASDALAGATARETAASNSAAAATRAQSAAMQHNTTLTRQAVAQRANLVFQLNDIFVSLASGMNPAMVAIQQGSQISTIYGPGGLGKALTETGNIAAGVATKFGPLVAITALVAAGVAGLTYEINRTGKGIEVSFGDTALAVLQTFGDYIWNALKPDVMAIGKWFNDDVWPAVTSGTADTINVMVKAWMGFLAEMELIGGSIEHVFDGAWVNIYNGAVDMMQQLLESMWTDINKLLVLVGQTPVKVDLSGMKMQADSGWSKDLMDKFNTRKDQIASTDYAGQFFGDVADHARDNYSDRQKPKKAGKQSDYEREIASIRERTGALQIESNVIGLGTFASEKLRKTFDLENAARKDAIGLTPRRIAEIEKEATAYAAAAAAVEQQKGAFEEISRVGESAIDSLVDAFFDGGKNIGDVLKGIAKDYAKMVLEMAVTNPIKNALFGGSNPTFGGGGGGGAGGGITGFLGNILSGLFGGAPKYAGGTSNHPGGLARINDGGGGEIVMLPGGSKVIPNDLSRQMVGGGGGDANVTVNVINNSGAEVRQSRKKNADGSVIQELVIGTVQRGMANDDFRANGVRGRTMSR